MYVCNKKFFLMTSIILLLPKNKIYSRRDWLIDACAFWLRHYFVCEGISKDVQVYVLHVYVCIKKLFLMTSIILLLPKNKINRRRDWLMCILILGVCIKCHIPFYLLMAFSDLFYYHLLLFFFFVETALTISSTV